MENKTKKNKGNKRKRAINVADINLVCQSLNVNGLNIPINKQSLSE